MPMRRAVRITRQAISPRLAIRILRKAGITKLVMAGRVPAIHVGVAEPPAVSQSLVMGNVWVYIVTNRPNGILYTGVTGNIARRAWEHREGIVEGFTKRYGLKRLVYVERHADIQTAIQREHNMKHWSRTWKVRLILAANPDWTDLYDQIL